MNTFFKRSSFVWNQQRLHVHTHPHSHTHTHTSAHPPRWGLTSGKRLSRVFLSRVSISISSIKPGGLFSLRGYIFGITCNSILATLLPHGWVGRLLYWGCWGGGAQLKWLKTGSRNRLHAPSPPNTYMRPVTGRYARGGVRFCTELIHVIMCPVPPAGCGGRWRLQVFRRVRRTD